MCVREWVCDAVQPTHSFLLDQIDCQKDSHTCTIAKHTHTLRHTKNVLQAPLQRHTCKHSHSLIPTPMNTHAHLQRHPHPHKHTHTHLQRHTRTHFPPSSVFGSFFCISIDFVTSFPTDRRPNHFPAPVCLSKNQH